jgi:hypothetical protein
MINKEIKDMGKIKEYSVEKQKEAVLYFDSKSRKYIYEKEEEKGLPSFERCVEIPWIKDKVSQIASKGMSLIDFGCNKAQYIIDLKKEYDLKTYGIDMKSQGSYFVDVFFKGQYNKKIKDKLISSGPYDIVTAISAVEHAGCKMHPDKDGIEKYQMDICKDLIENSSHFFLSAPYGKRPGWAEDQSRKNLYQFDLDLVNKIIDFSSSIGKSSLTETYMLKEEYWEKSDLKECSDCIYRNNKQGASAIVLLSIWS